MPRQARTASGTGIYHIMMRGVNRRNIFDDDEDRQRFVQILDGLPFQYDEQGTLLPIRTCSLYAWCLMTNHFHLLIRERDWKISEVIKSLASSYVFYYNKKNERIGHLFHERFKREPCNDMEYFVTLLRYIHQNPVKAGIAERVKDYEYSSWSEFDGTVEPVFQICDTRTVLNRIPFKDLEEWVNDPLDDDIQCLEIEKKVYSKPSDDQVWLMIKEQTGATSSTAFQQLADEIKRDTLRQLRDSGASHRQLERLTGVGRGLIQKL